MAEQPTTRTMMRGLSFPLLVSGFYALVAGLYISLSDRIVLGMIDDPQRLTVVQTYKGWAFIGTTAVGLFLILLYHERRRSEAQRVLAESERKYRQMIETTNEGVWIINEHAITTFVNETMAGMLGYAREEMVGRPREDFVAEEWKQIAAEQFKRRQEGLWDQYECQFVHSSGKPVWAIVASTPMQDASRKFCGSVKMLTDITKRKADELALKASYEAQRQLLNELDHRVRNNLSSLYGLLNTAKVATRDVDHLATSLGGRLSAMSRAYGLLSSSNWSSPDVEGVLNALIPGKVRSQFQLRGPRVLVSPQQSGALALAMHELIANSVIHGAASVPGGVTEVEWKAEPTGDGAMRVAMTWRERGGPIIPGEPKFGAGLSLLQGLIRTDLHGEVQLSFLPAGASHILTFTCDAPSEAPVHSQLA